MFENKIDKTPKVFIRTFGCQMNFHDSEKIAGVFSEYGYEETQNVEEAQVIIINTCSVRQKAEQKFLSELGRLKNLKAKNSELKVLIAGCVAQQKGNALFDRFPYVDFVFGPQNIDALETWINSSLSNSARVNNRTYLKTIPIKRVGQVRAWVEVMYGCDNFCSYCIVPYTRGRERSRPPSDILNEIKEIAAQGFKEVTLLGQNVNSYGKGLPEDIDFSDILKMVNEVDGIHRIRFVTSHPRDLSEKLIKTLRDLPKICEHIHLPIQSGSDRILSCMNRGYTYRQYKEKIDMLRSAIPDIAITTDIIVGFPGESEEDFEDTLTALREIEYDGIFAFKYSPRPMTAAVSLSGHIDEKTKAERLSKVLNLQADITYKKNKALEGRTVEVLVEGVSETDRDKLTGRTRSNKIVNFYGGQKYIGDQMALAGNLVMVKILKAKQHSLYGEIL